jgi:hypothetical protein
MWLVGEKAEAASVKLTSLLADIASNKETFIASHKVPQIDAEERRKVLTIVGPARLIDALTDALTGG